MRPYLDQFPNKIHSMGYTSMGVHGFIGVFTVTFMYPHRYTINGVHALINKFISYIVLTVDTALYKYIYVMLHCYKLNNCFKNKGITISYLDKI